MGAPCLMSAGQPEAAARLKGSTSTAGWGKVPPEVKALVMEHYYQSLAVAIQRSPPQALALLPPAVVFTRTLKAVRLVSTEFDWLVRPLVWRKVTLDYLPARTVKQWAKSVPRDIAVHVQEIFLRLLPHDDSWETSPLMVLRDIVRQLPHVKIVAFEGRPGSLGTTDVKFDVTSSAKNFTLYINGYDSHKWDGTCESLEVALSLPNVERLAINPHRLPLACRTPWASPPSSTLRSLMLCHADIRPDELLRFLGHTALTELGLVHCYNIALEQLPLVLKTVGASLQTFSIAFNRFKTKEASSSPALPLPALVRLSLDSKCFRRIGALFDNAPVKTLIIKRSEFSIPALTVDEEELTEFGRMEPRTADDLEFACVAGLCGFVKLHSGHLRKLVLSCEEVVGGYEEDVLPAEVVDRCREAGVAIEWEEWEGFCPRPKLPYYGVLV